MILHTIPFFPYCDHKKYNYFAMVQDSDQQILCLTFYVIFSALGSFKEYVAQNFMTIEWTRNKCKKNKESIYRVNYIEKNIFCVCSPTGQIPSFLKPFLTLMIKIIQICQLYLYVVPTLKLCEINNNSSQIHWLYSFDISI